MDINEVAVRIEEAYARSNQQEKSPQAQYDLYESIAIQILDSEFMHYGEGELEAYLVAFLEEKRFKLLGVDN